MTRESLMRLKERFDEILEEPEEAFQFVRKGLGVLIGISVASTAATFGLIYVQVGDTLSVFTTAFLFWAGYIFAHYSASGKLVHQGGKGTVLPAEVRYEALAFVGVIIGFGGFTAMILEVGRGSVGGGLAAGLVAAAGYLTTHYATTGQLL